MNSQIVHEFVENFCKAELGACWKFGEYSRVVGISRGIPAGHLRSMLEQAAMAIKEALLSVESMDTVIRMRRASGELCDESATLTPAQSCCLRIYCLRPKHAMQICLLTYKWDAQRACGRQAFSFELTKYLVKV